MDGSMDANSMDGWVKIDRLFYQFFHLISGEQVVEYS